MIPLIGIAIKVYDGTFYCYRSLDCDAAAVPYLTVLLFFWLTMLGSWLFRSTGMLLPAMLRMSYTKGIVW